MVKMGALSLEVGRSRRNVTCHLSFATRHLLLFILNIHLKCLYKGATFMV